MSDSPKGITLVYACSGVANTGLLADQIARRFHADGGGVVKMTCLAAMGAETAKFVSEAKAADRRIVIDGCPISCGASIFTRVGIPFEHYRTTDFGVEKGKTAITPELIDKTHATIKEAIGRGR
jgi:uncharacterized metal-binding protein